MTKEEFLKKYDRPGPRYTSYPPATLFSESYGEAEHLEELRASDREGGNISLYLHIPYCHNRCLYCGCNSEALCSDAQTERYLAALKREISLVAQKLDPSRPVSQIHWGGGTPNALSQGMIAGVMDFLRQKFSLAPDGEFAMECDPSLVDGGSLEFLRAEGFNRLSFGIQDLNSEVLARVARKPSKLPPEELVARSRALGFRGINLDFIYGLPGQSAASFSETMRRAVAADPDRLVTFSYAHVPWMKPRQKEMEAFGLPSPDEKLSMLVAGLEIARAAGYEMIGMDHYARHDDELAQAARERTLHRNFQGYCTRRTTAQVYAFGASSISQLDGAYAQNERDPAAYIRRIEKGGLAVARGFTLSAENRFYRDLIGDIMCNGRIDASGIKQAHGLPAEETLPHLLKEKRPQLEAFAEDGLLELGAEGLFTVTEQGRMVVRVIAMCFDPLLVESEGRYSRTV
ncbi:MAG: oxygen-independent coproporphyrinogen III oxidase [Planctomycetes bacterium]|nr:oxygen-independent coproporphyrinogen III oxidase [Planctomycetota bacterium]